MRNVSQGPVLEVIDLSVRYTEDGPDVLKQLSCEVSEGEFVLVAGPSGGGKSSLLYAINGVIPHLTAAEVTGDILLYGESVMDRSPSVRSRQLGSVLQNADDQLIFDRVDDEVAFPLENLQVDPALMPDKVSRALARMDIPADADPKVLSGGEKQRLITATTLGMEQRVLLLDEPLANLDYKGAISLLDTLQQLCREEGYAVIFVEHRLDWVLDYADKILWIDSSGHEFFREKQAFVHFWDKLIEGTLTDCWQDQGYVASSETVMAATNLTWTTKGQAILHGIDFELRHGERWVLIGDNGSGKSSFLNLLVGLRRPTGGRVTSAFRKKEMFRRIGVIMQNPNYQLFMSSVRQEIAYQAVSEARVDELILAFELEGLEDRHPHSLSEGQKRKVGVAAVLAMDPEVLLFDEPTVGQDYRSLGLIIQELSRMNARRPMTMLTITHDTRCAHFLADHVLWLEDGLVYEAGDSSLLALYLEERSVGIDVC